MMSTVPPRHSDEPEDLTRFKELLLHSCGHCFHNEREQALSAALGQRMASQGMNALDAYFALLARDREELRRLTELLTVNETYFFREPDHLNLVVDTLLPEFLNIQPNRPAKIVSAGCSTGEEPYSIAIMLREKFGAASEHMFALIGVDIDSTAIATARRGEYGNTSFRGMDQALRQRYFEPSGLGKSQISTAVKNQVHFEVVNLLHPPFPPQMQAPDIILYRNVSIYFPEQVQREIFGNLAQLLAEGGCLLVGASETIHHDIGILTLVRQESLFFYRKTPGLLFVDRRRSSRSASPPEQRRSGSLPPTPRPPSSSGGQQRRMQEGTRYEPSGKRSPADAPLDTKMRFDEALRLAHNNEHDQALALLDEIIARDRDFDKAYSLKASLLVNAARFEEANAVCEGILERDPLCLEAYLMLGMAARHNGNNDEAFKRFREAIYLDPSCWLAHFYTAEILFGQQELKRARSSYETALKILGSGILKEQGQAFFPLSFNAEQFMVICRHKLSRLQENG